MLEPTTPRLRLRAWRPADLPEFAALNAHPDVARFLGGPLTREASDALAARMQWQLEQDGLGWWAVQVPGVADFVGAVGLTTVGFEAPFAPCVEIGWRLAPAWWNRGYATEAARAALGHGFERLRLEEIVSFTVPANGASRRVMEKLGMTRDATGDFAHPRLPAGHPLSHHVLYRIRRPADGTRAIDRPA